MKRIIFITIVLSFFLVCVAQASISKNLVAVKAVGNWIGKGKIIVNWCKQDSLTLDITIKEDGTVTGNIGDATIEKGKISKRNPIMRLLGNGKYIIHADLNGCLVKDEDIQRKSVHLMLLDFKDDLIEGEINTSGSKTGGKAKMYMKIVNIKLRRK